MVSSSWRTTMWDKRQVFSLKIATLIGENTGLTPNNAKSTRTCSLARSIKITFNFFFFFFELFLYIAKLNS